MVEMGAQPMWKHKGSQRKLEKLCRVTMQESSEEGKVHFKDELEKELGGGVVMEADKGRQVDKGVGLQEIKRGNGQDTLQDGGSSIGNGVNVGRGFCHNTGSEECISSCQGREESESVHGFQFRQQEFYVRRNALWVDEEPCNFLQCAEAGDQGNQRKMGSEGNFLYRRYSAYGLGQGKAWKVYFGSDEVSGGVGLVAGSGQMSNESEKEVRVSRLGMEFGEEGGLHSEAKARVTEKEHKELDGVDEERKESQSENDYCDSRGTELFEDLVRGCVFTSECDQQVKDKGGKGNKLERKVLFNEENQGRVGVVEEEGQRELTAEVRCT
ncbi:MAG: hypothetical protein EZS28_037563 [Streblomastix strix]|uniref:Uncharacterized protein n=1 Tax=Streblomastix strix TaxID=222440 RepID=A0A5J4U9L9_9EUKA|nr:MAG: hypothetical protein EZS28_037563 [Streblomastix strix]